VILRSAEERGLASAFNREEIMRSLQILVSLAVLFLSGVGSAEEEKEAGKSAEKFDGKWYTVRQEQFGGPIPAVVAERLYVVIDGDKMEWYIGNPAPNFAATLTIDAEKKTIDAKVTRGSLIGKTMHGIYKFENDMLHICWSEIDAERPKKFETTKPGGGVFEYTTYSREKPDPKKAAVEPKKVASDPVKKEPAAGKRPKLADLKLTLPKGWEAKHHDGSNSWEISRGFGEVILVGWAATRDYPKDLDDYVEKLKTNGDHFAYGLSWTSVTEKGKLPDGLYVVGKVKLKTDKEDRGTAFSILRELGGEKVIFECFSNDIAADPKLREEATAICKSAKY